MRIDSLGSDEFLRMRAIRLRALLDWPDAFGRTHAEEEAKSDQFWIDRLTGNASVCFLAQQGDRDVGIVHGAADRDQEGVAGLFGMWVAPEARGRGFGDALVQRVIDWAKGERYQRLLLHVADENPHAIALYARMGFEPTGARGTLPPPRDHVTEHERGLQL